MLDITAENAFLILKKYLGEKNQNKYLHSIRVAKTAKMLAEKWGVSKEDAVIVGLLHDIGKSLSSREMLELCVRNGIEMFDFELFGCAVALHGKASSLLFKKEFKEDDSERFNAISDAICSHVAGSEDMSDLGKVVFIADNIEPEKNNDILSRIQSGELNDINECIREIIKDKIKRAQKEQREINPILNATLESIDEEDR